MKRAGNCVQFLDEGYGLYFVLGTASVDHCCSFSTNLLKLFTITVLEMSWDTV